MDGPGAVAVGRDARNPYELSQVPAFVGHFFLMEDDLAGERRSLGLLIAGVAVVFTLGSVADAADAGGDFAIKGGGLQTCGNFLAAWDDGSRDLALYGGWIEGYVTGLNQNLDGTFDLLAWQSTETALSLTRAICLNLSPNDLFINAVDQLVRILLPSRVSQKSGAVAIRDGDRALVIYSVVLERMNKSLAERGYDVGNLDSFSDSSRAALAAFQRDMGIAQTGIPDQQTLIKLFVQ